MQNIIFSSVQHHINIDLNCVYMQDFFRCAPGYEEEARVVAKHACKALVHGMHYEARIQAIIDWHAANTKVMYKRGQAKSMELTREQYLSVSIDLE